MIRTVPAVNHLCEINKKGIQNIDYKVYKTIYVKYVVNGPIIRRFKIRIHAENVDCSAGCEKN